jgi:hypothetical protein
METSTTTTTTTTTTTETTSTSTTTLSPPPTTTQPSHKKTHTHTLTLLAANFSNDAAAEDAKLLAAPTNPAPMILGIVGGILFLILLILFLWWLRRRLAMGARRIKEGDHFLPARKNIQFKVYDDDSRIFRAEIEEQMDDRLAGMGELDSTMGTSFSNLASQMIAKNQAKAGEKTTTDDYQAMSEESSTKPPPASNTTITNKKARSQSVKELGDTLSGLLGTSAAVTTQQRKRGVSTALDVDVNDNDSFSDYFGAVSAAAAALVTKEKETNPNQDDVDVDAYFGEGDRKSDALPNDSDLSAFFKEALGGAPPASTSSSAKKDSSSKRTSNKYQDQHF